MIEILKHQAEFIQSNYRHTGLVGGFRSGKSHAGVIKTIVKKMQLNKIDVAYYLPTYPLIKDIAFPKISEMLTEMKIPFTLNKTDKDFILNNGRIICRSMDNPDLIIGYEVGYSLVDEADVLSKSKMQETMIKILARNSAKADNCNNATDFVSTPEGFKFLYDFFVKQSSENKYLIKATTKNNPFISEDYINALTEQYNEQQLLAYLDGEFVNLTAGTVFSDYDGIQHHTDREVTESDTLHIGMDFNITNMSAVVHIYEGGVAHAVDEFVRYYDTHELCQAIKQRYPNHKINVYPDASGNNRRSAGESDFTEIKKFKFNLLSLSKNSLVKDRINTTNMVFRQGKYKVNRFKCPNYSEALTQLPYKNGEPDKSSGFDHITDAGTYYINFIFNKTRGTVYL
jgi:PBSX family phage terminase large subunit